MEPSAGPGEGGESFAAPVTGLEVLAAAAVAGITGDALLRVGPPGLNVALWAAVLVALVLALTRGRPVVSRGGDTVAAAALIVFAAGFAWRAAGMLLLLDVLALGVLISLAALRRPLARLATSGLLDYALGAATAAVHVMVGPFLLVAKDVKWKQASRGRWGRTLFPALRGTLLAVPFLLLFGSLLMGADVVFDDLVRRTFHLNLPPNLLSHALLILFFAWITGGFLRGTFFFRPQSLPRPERPAQLSLGATEIAVALGLLDALFLAFVWVQFRYFFGGAERVMITPGLTYAEYARRGFFELSAVSALVLPLLLAGHWLLRREKPADERRFRGVAGVMVVLIFVIMASALERMRLYQAEYGMTELRLYTTAFMLWLAFVFAWFLLTVLRGRRERFAFGAMVAGFASILALHALNPDAFIARINIARAAEGKKFDAVYVSRLSDDAVPTLLSLLPKLGAQDRCVVAQRILRRQKVRGSKGWRSWNWSRQRARDALREDRPYLLALPCSSLPPE